MKRLKSLEHNLIETASGTVVLRRSITHSLHSIGDGNTQQADEKNQAQNHTVTARILLDIIEEIA